MHLLLEGTKADLFCNVFKSVPQFSTDVNLTFNEDSVYCQTMDSNKVCLLELNLTKEWFNEYSIDDEDKTVVGINSNILQLILKCRDQSQCITIKYAGDPEYLDIVFTTPDEEGENTKSKVVLDKEFQLPLFELDYAPLKLPSDSEWDADIGVSSGVFQKLVSELCNFSDDCTFKCYDELVEIHADGSMGKYKVTIPSEQMEFYSIIEGEELNLQFALKYFNIITSFAKVSETTLIQLSKSLPLKVTYIINDGTDIDDYDDITEYFETKNCIKLYLAPKYEDD